jgi:hypothetical protein
MAIGKLILGFLGFVTRFVILVAILLFSCDIFTKSSSAIAKILHTSLEKVLLWHGFIWKTLAVDLMR